MFDLLVWGTLAVCLLSMVYAYTSSQDVFHPAILIAPLCAFIYGYMPLHLQKDNTLFSYVTEDQAIFGQTLAVLGISALMAGCFSGASKTVSVPIPVSYTHLTLPTILRV